MVRQPIKQRRAMQTDLGSPAGYPSTVVATISGLSQRQLEYLDGPLELAVPTVSKAKGSGSRRLYSSDDVVRTAAIAALLNAGMTHNALKTILPSPSAPLGESWLWASDDELVTVSLNLAQLRARVQVELASFEESLVFAE